MSLFIKEESPQVDLGVIWEQQSCQEYSPATGCTEQTSTAAFKVHNESLFQRAKNTQQNILEQE